MTQPNYHNGQFHQYYPSENQSPISQSPATSVHKTFYRNEYYTNIIDINYILNFNNTIHKPAHCSSHAAVSRDAHRTLTPFAPIALVESLTKTNHLLVADMKGELQSINNQLYIPIQERSKHKHLKK